MPNVGGKRFPYTPAGRAAANRYARQTGRPMNGGGYGGGGTLKPLPGVGGYGGKGMPSTVTGQPMGNDAIDGLINGGQKRGWLGNRMGGGIGGGRPSMPGRRPQNPFMGGGYGGGIPAPHPGTPPTPPPPPDVIFNTRPQSDYLDDWNYSKNVPQRRKPQRPIMGGGRSGGFLGPRRGRGRLG